MKTRGGFMGRAELGMEGVEGPSARPVRIVLHGVRGPIQVLEKTHTGDMPPLGVLPDEQIAAILTYVRRAWGHTASPVDPGEVKRIRTATADHTDAWSPEELKQIP